MADSFATLSRSIPSGLCFWNLLLGRLHRYQCFLDNTLNPFALEKGGTLEKGVALGWISFYKFCVDMA